MKYFDKLSPAVSSAFENRAVNVDKLKYCVKADLDYDGCYYDVYITFDDEKLYILSGYEQTCKKRTLLNAGFDFKDFCEYSVSDFEKLYVDQVSVRIPAHGEKKRRYRQDYRAFFPPDLLKNSSSSAAGSTA